MNTLAIESAFLGMTGVTGGFPAAPLRGAVEHVLQREDRGAVIQLTFLSPRAMQRLNQETFGHDYPTDVISFPLPLPAERLLGDLYLCRHVAAASAHQHRCTLREELLRLVIHGTLHVLGWDHPVGNQRLTSPMWMRQEQYLAELVC